RVAGSGAKLRDCRAVRRRAWTALAVVALLTLLPALPALAQDAAKEPAYRAFPLIGSRLAVWAVAQLHLNFAAFILGCPIFAVIIEIIGWRTRDEKYDWLAHEFVKLTFAAFSTTALLGAFLLFLFVGYYPKFWTYMTSIFFPTYWVYALLFFAETFTVYVWYYGWDWLSGPRKGIHVGLGVLSNLFGTAILLVANSWVTFMISPAGIDESGALKGSVWAAINNFTWMPINIHRLIANIVFGGTIAAAYAAFRFLNATTDEERARYDWMGYVGNFVALSAFIVLPFAGYWLGREIYAFNQTMGITPFLSYVLYRRANRLSIKPWVLTGMAIQWGAFFVAAAIVVFYGVYGYFVESIVRIGFSVYQVGAVLGAIALVMTIDVPMF